MAMPRSDSDWMRAALAMARRGLGRTWPNPAVGCVLVRDGRIVGRGHTSPGGRPHAETMALAAAGSSAAGATAYVTLEPCAHQGQTPPCAAALIAASVTRVVTAQTDPDPRVDGGGHAMLRAAGIAVTTGVCADEAADVNAGFLCRVHHGRPMITLKLATSLDGRIAMANGESRWITGPDARRRVHAMRADHDAVLIGSGTALADDPMLDIRGMGSLPNPVRVIFDSRLAIPTDARLVATAREIPTWIVHSASAAASRRAALEDAGVTCISVAPAGSGRIDPVSALRALGERGLTRVFCEGGGTLAATLLECDLVDRLALFTAGKTIGATGIPALGALELGALVDTARFSLRSTSPVGADALSQWTRSQWTRIQRQ